MDGVNFCPVKKLENDTISNDVKAFLNSGGKITPVAFGVSNDNKHPFADSMERSDAVKESTSRGGKNAAVSKRK